MVDSPDISVLAIDGGGTRCRFALLSAGTRHTVEAGSANVSTDFDEAVRCLREGIQALSRLSGLTPDTLHALPAFVGLAGMAGTELTQRLTRALPLRNVQYADDRIAAMRGALGRKDGMLAHCGTGSFFAAQVGGVQRLAGGWGCVLGDEASAQWVGRKALTQLLRQIDGYTQSSPLTEDLLKQFGDPAGVVEFARTATPATFGALAPQVTSHAERGDVIARKILQAGADQVMRGLDHMGWTSGMPICLTGGIGPHYAPYLSGAMQADVAKPDGEPIDGAIALAQERHMETADGHC